VSAMKSIYVNPVVYFNYSYCYFNYSYCYVSGYREHSVQYSPDCFCILSPYHARYMKILMYQSVSLF
jgi:hypothetical protein